MRENWLRWFGHVKRKPTDALVRRCDYKTEVQAEGVDEELGKLGKRL